MRIKITFSYDGSKFNGFQRLENLRSVQKEIEGALSNIFNQEVEIKGAGRTDAGVHANNQVAHFDVDKNVSNLKQKMNNILNPDIYIKKLNVVSEKFHARKSARKKEYIYRINLGPYQSSLNDYYYQPRYKIDLSLMRDAAKLFIGTHDFKNFVAGKRDDYTSTIYSITIIKTFNKLELRFIGVGFYRYMVRNLVGSLLEVGKCRIKSSEIKSMLDNPKKEIKLPTAPPQGLYLNKIWY
ncbi:MAG: tRNA pseudouridine(38-40) synthase TruA [Firmicutes bacterium]|nr:tRNA pseudouridine(38-40) synthase TruA [Bacillota bacterium]